MAVAATHGIAATMADFVATFLDAALAGAEDESAAQGRVLELFRSVTREVPAYRAFLAEHNVDPASIGSYADFTGLPLIDKRNYHSRYPLRDLCRNGRLEANDFVAVSSGSTGQPTFWPRSFIDELTIARRFEQAFRDSFRAHERRTLAIVCFALGTWLGGMYPPFLKDVIDTGRASGLNWAAFKPKLVMAGDVFSEEWRTLVAERTVDGRLVFSGDNGIPLIRYNIADSGGVIAYERMLEFLRARGFDPHDDLDGRAVRSLPFVYVFGRADFTISYFGANVYPENVTVGLEQSPIDSWATGKFVMQAREDADRNADLSIVVELALRDPAYFPVGVKNRYARR